MDINKKTELLAEILDADEEKLTPEARLDEFEWDSVSVLSFIVMMDNEFGKEITGEVVKSLVTVQDAFDIMEND